MMEVPTPPKRDRGPTPSVTRERRGRTPATGKHGYGWRAGKRSARSSGTEGIVFSDSAACEGAGSSAGAGADASASSAGSGSAAGASAICASCLSSVRWLNRSVDIRYIVRSVRRNVCLTGRGNRRPSRRIGCVARQVVE